MRIIDSSPIIAILGNLDNPELLRLFTSLGYKLYISPLVYGEIKKDPEKSNLGAMLKEGIINLLEPINPNKLQVFRNSYPQLGDGELETILIALTYRNQGKKFCCIIDDKNARRIAEELGLKCNGTCGILNELLDYKLITPQEFSSLLSTLKAKGFRYKFNNLGGV